MKKKERETLAQQGVDELVEKEKQLKEASWKLRLQQATGQLGEPEPAEGGAPRHRAGQDVSGGRWSLRRRSDGSDPEATKHASPAPTKVGRVVSDKMNKTIVVEVERRVQEARYQRTIRRTSRFMAHDEGNKAKSATASASRRRARCRSGSAGS